jgi:hypothetical protein
MLAYDMILVYGKMYFYASTTNLFTKKRNIVHTYDKIYDKGLGSETVSDLWYPDSDPTVKIWIRITVLLASSLRAFQIFLNNLVRYQNI